MEKESNCKSWEILIKGWENSDLSQRRYCRDHNINIDRFYYHRKKLRKKKQFIELPGIKIQNQPIEIYIDSKKLTVKIPESFCEQTLLRLLETLGVHDYVC